MKLLQKFFVVAMTVSVASSAWADDLQKFLTEGQTAMVRGDYATAKRNFEIVTRADPRNAVAIGYLKQIKVIEAKNPGSGDQEKALQQLIIPQVSLKEATLGATLDMLKKKAAELSNGKQNVNFVMQLPPEQQDKPVTLSLTNIPFTEALRYVAEMANAKVEYQKFAVVIKPAGSPAVQKAANEPIPQ